MEVDMDLEFRGMIVILNQNMKDMKDSGRMTRRKDMEKSCGAAGIHMRGNSKIINITDMES